MIGPTGPTPNLLRQYELGAVPKEMAEEHDADGGPHDGRGARGGEEGTLPSAPVPVLASALNHPAVPLAVA